jgi:arginase family enzyme
MENLFMIDVQTNNTKIKNKVINKIDYEVVPEMFEKLSEENIPIIYNFMYRYVKLLNKKIIVTFSSDPTISSSTIAGMNEKFITREFLGENDILFKSELRIIYITSTTHLLPLKKDNLYNSILSNLMYEKITFTKHNQVLLPEQIVLLGTDLDLLSEQEKDILDKSNITYFSTKQIKKKSLKNIVEYIITKFKNNPVHIIFDLGCVNNKICPLKLIDSNSYLTLDDIDFMFSEFSKLTINSMDITNYVLNIDEKNIKFRVTCETIRRPLIKLFNLKTQKINIFNEDTKFLIWRPAIQLSKDDIGWFILRKISTDNKEKLIKEIDDTIQTITVENDDGEPIDILVSTTTMNEQNEISYYTVDTIEECALDPTEKTQMMFELLMKYEEK